jgi:prepilin-type N-terminal cleavage/methylation domain-containing protein
MWAGHDCRWETRRKAQQKRKYMRKQKQGFTLVEIMIVVAIIALLAGIAVSSFMSSRNKTMVANCQNNLRLIDGAVQQYALDRSNALAGSMAVLVGTNAYIKDTPVCKGGGTYTLPASLGGKTSCSSHGTL